MNKFKIGDRVKCLNDYHGVPEVATTRGQLAQISSTGVMITVEWENKKVNDYFMRNWPGALRGGNWGAHDWERVPPSITDWSKVTTRAGYPVEQVIGAKDRASALVTVGGKKLALTYNEHGEFYPGFESPVDLVQT